MLRRSKFQRATSIPDVYSTAINVLFLGAARVGKSSLVAKLLGREFIEEYIPTVYDVFSKEVTHENGRFIFQITDMSGYYSFPPMRRLAIKNSSIFVLVYELGNMSSYAEVGRLKEEILQMKKASEIAIIIVGNKTDCVNPGMVKDVEIEDAVIACSFCSLKVSAKTSESLDRLQNCLLEASSSVIMNIHKNTSGRKKSRLQPSRTVAL